MKRFLRNLVIVNAVIALAVGLIGWSGDWTASDYTLALLVVTGLAFFAAAAALGGGGPMTIGGGRMGGLFGRAASSVAAGEEVKAAFAQEPGSTPGDFHDRWRARQGSVAGTGVFVLMLATAITTGIAAVLSWKLFE